jgi:hypothetical protein
VGGRTNTFEERLGIKTTLCAEVFLSNIQHRLRRFSTFGMTTHTVGNHQQMPILPVVIEDTNAILLLAAASNVEGFGKIPRHKRVSLQPSQRSGRHGLRAFRTTI